MWLPDINYVEDIHLTLAKIFSNENDPISPAGIKSRPLLESACERPNTGIGGQDKYQSLEEKLAALFHSLTKNHPFHNGNKRTAIATILTSLHRNGRRLESNVTDDLLYNFVVSVTADEFPKPDHGKTVDQVVEHISNWIKNNSVPTRPQTTGMKTRNFIDKCVAAGCHCKNSSGGTYVISNKKFSIRISKSTRQLDGGAIKKYLGMLNLNPIETGLSIEEFQEGSNDERAQIYRYMATLRRLAKT